MSTACSRTALVAVSLAASTVLAGCGAGEVSDDGLVRVSFASPAAPTMFTYPFLVADVMGFFADEGLDVEFLPGSEDVPPVTLVSTGRAQIGMGSAAEVFYATTAGADVNAVFDSYTRSAEGIAVPEGGVVEDVADLRGARVGLASDEMRQFVLSAIGPAGLGPDDIEMVVIGSTGAALVAELESGSIDAFAGSQVDFVSLESVGLPLRDITPERLQGVPTAALLVEGGWAAANPDLVEGFLRAYAKGTRIGVDHPEVAGGIARREVPDEWVDEDAGAAYFDLVLELHRPRGELVGEIARDGWDVALDDLLAVGELDAPIPIDDVVDDSFLDGANDFDQAELDAAATSWAG